MFPKRCGHLESKVVVSCDEFMQRIRAAASERYFVVIACTDARQPLGFDEAMNRIRRAFDAGADGVSLKVPPRGLRSSGPSPRRPAG